MFVPYALYFVISLAALATLSVMILRIGAVMGDCPQTGRTARAGALAIVSGFVVIGAGGLALIAALIGLSDLPPVVASFGTLGVALVALGIGFASAVGALRDMVVRAQNPRIAAPAEPAQPAA